MYRLEMESIEDVRDAFPGGAITVV